MFGFVCQLWTRAPSCCHVQDQKYQGYYTGVLYWQHHSYRYLTLTSTCTVTDTSLSYPPLHTPRGHTSLTDWGHVDITHFYSLLQPEKPFVNNPIPQGILWNCLFSLCMSCHALGWTQIRNQLFCHLYFDHSLSVMLVSAILYLSVRFIAFSVFYCTQNLLLCSHPTPHSPLSNRSGPNVQNVATAVEQVYPLLFECRKPLCK